MQETRPDTKCKLPLVRELLRQRLQEVADEICGLFERTVTDYEDELSRVKANYQHLNLLDGVFSPKVHIHRPVFPADGQPTFVIKEEVLSEWDPSLGQDEEPEPLRVKAEQEELWPSLEEEQVEADITGLPFAAVPVRSGDNKQEPPTSQLPQSQADDNKEAEPLHSSPAKKREVETDGEDCGGGSDPQKSPLQPNTGEKTSDFSKTDVCGDVCWLGLISGSKRGFRVIQMVDSQRRVHKKEKRFVRGKTLKHQSRKQVHTGERPFGCSVCGKRFYQRSSLNRHMGAHTGEKPYGCSVCGKRASQLCHLKSHMRVHTGEKPYGCGVCGKSFQQPSSLNRHMRVHTGEKPYGCSVCGKRLNQLCHLKSHMGVHTGEKPYGCGVCGKRFHQNFSLKRHLRVHTGEKPFGCGVCGKRFHQNFGLKRHLRVHTGEKPFGCGVCGKRFNQLCHLDAHTRVHARQRELVCST